jgi:hypothetical protein
VVEMANEQYGLSVYGFTGPISKYDTNGKAAYLNVDSIAVTSYSGLFNTNPFFDSPDVIILDDAHAAENYISSLWALKIDQTNTVLHTAVSNLIKPLLNPADYARLMGETNSMADLTWVDKIPTPEFIKLQDELHGIVSTHVKDTDLRYSWSMIEDHLGACHMYLSPKDILIRPLIPPTWSHAPFENAKQRIYMSATLGLGGDLERLTGRKKIERLPIPDGWDRQGIGRRFFLFPEMSLEDTEIPALATALMKEAGRSVVLSPNDKSVKDLKKYVEETLSFKVFGAADIEQSKKDFVSEQEAVAIIANRYDGIDFPGDDCRLLFVDDLPRATNTQEKFFLYRMGANLLYNERIQTRVLQAMGRCTRSSEDSSAVIVTGEELLRYLLNPKRQKYLHPELQAEIQYGITQSKDCKDTDFVDNLKVFLENDKEWEEANNDILALRQDMVQVPFPAIEMLGSVVTYEVEYQKRLWQGDWDEALRQCEQVLKSLQSDDLSGYRAIWSYLAGSAAWLNRDEKTAREYFRAAKNMASGISWLVSLSRYQAKEEPETADKIHLLKQLEKLELIFSKYGIGQSKKYDNIEKQIIDGLEGKISFEHAHLLLGEWLGFDSRKVEADASPDPWWTVGEICFVFEDHADAKPSTVLDATKARQVSSHPKWMKEHAGLDDKTKVLPVLVSPVSIATKGAMPHLNDVHYWSLDEFKQWAKNALSVIRELKRKFVESGDLVWRAEAAEAFEKNMLDAPSIEKFLKSRIASKILKAEK